MLCALVVWTAAEIGLTVAGIAAFVVVWMAADCCEMKGDREI